MLVKCLLVLVTIVIACLNSFFLSLLQFDIPHQWMEGNLPAGSKCVVCERACGSVRRLQDYRCIWCKWTVSGVRA